MNTLLDYLHRHSRGELDCVGIAGAQVQEVLPRAVRSDRQAGGGEDASRQRHNRRAGHLHQRTPDRPLQPREPYRQPLGERL